MPPIAQATLYVLGPTHLVVDGRRAVVRRRRALALLVYLAMERRMRSRDALAALFWPDASMSDARTSLRRALADLNALLGRGWSIADDDSVAIDPAFPLGLDLDAFSAHGGALPHGIDALDDRMAACKAAFGEGLHLPDLDAWQEWMYAQAQAVKRRQRDFAQRATAAAWQQGDVERALRWTSIWCGLDDLDEHAFRAHLEALARAGRTDRIGTEFQQFRARLQRELDVEPSLETRQLFLKLRTQAHVRTPDKPAPPRAEVRYVESDGVRLATRVVGNDGPWLLLIAGFATHLDLMLEHPDQRAFLQRLGAGMRVLLYDKRGMGLSDRSLPGTPEQNAHDAMRLLDAYRIDEAHVLGCCEGGPAAIELASRAPDRVASMVLDGTSACWSATPDYPHAVPAQVYAEWIEEMQLRWGSAVGVSQFAPSRATDASVVTWWARMLRSSASPGAIKDIFASASGIDVRDRLDKVTQPVLVTHRRGDRIVRAANGRFLADHLAHARHLEQDGSDHWHWTEHGPALAEAMRSFLELSRSSHARR